MKTLSCLFSTSQLPGAIAIRGLTWSDWSHVAIIDGDEAIEAVWPKVRVSKLSDVIAAHTSHAIVSFPCADPSAAIQAARSQVGKSYDLKPLLGLPFHRDWQDEDKWFCSELFAWAIAQGGSPLFRASVMHRVVPQDLWMLAPA